MIIAAPQLNKTDAEDQFAAWLTTQTNANGNTFKPFVAYEYSRNLRTAPPKLDISLSLSERDVFRCRTTADFDALNSVFQVAPNFREVNHGANHGAFSAGLAAYRRYLLFIERVGEQERLEEEILHSVPASVNSKIVTTGELRIVDFTHPELCTGCNPTSCTVEGNDYDIGNWRDILVVLAKAFLQSKPKAMELYHTNLYPKSERKFLLRDRPIFSARQLSNGYWVNVNLSIKDLVFTIGKLCEFCGVDLNNVNITYVPKQNAGGMRLKLPYINTVSTESIDFVRVPDVLIDALNEHYSMGFRFEITYISLLSNVSGMEMDARMQAALKRMMFHRDDGIYFLLDIVADSITRKDIIDFADDYLHEYGCFEVSELYKLYADKVNSKCITYIPVDSYGTVSVADIEAAIRPYTKLVTLMFANNEIGTVQPITEIGRLLRGRSILFHTDAVQAVGHIPVNVNDLGVDFLTASAHKFNGAKGTGILYKRAGSEIPPLVYGGEQERGLRAGTENVAGIVSAGCAIEENVMIMADEADRLSMMIKATIDSIKEKIPSVRINGDRDYRLPGTVNFGFDGISGESLMHLLDLKGICVSTSSACKSGNDEPSHVLLAMGQTETQAKSAIRISYGKYNTRNEVEIIVKAICNIYNKITELR